MNKENMLKVADAIEARQVADKEIGFNMYSFVDDKSYRSGFFGDSPVDANGNVCGTTACVAGFAALLQRAERGKKNVVPKYDHAKMRSFYDIGRSYLGLKEHQADNLFLEAVYDFNENDPLVPDAIRWMALTESCDWKKAIKAVKCMRKQERKS